MDLSLAFEELVRIGKIGPVDESDLHGALAEEQGTDQTFIPRTVTVEHVRHLRVDFFVQVGHQAEQEVTRLSRQPGNLRRVGLGDGGKRPFHRGTNSVVVSRRRAVRKPRTYFCDPLVSYF